MHPRDGDLVRRVLPGYVAFDPLKLRKRLNRLLKLKESLAESNNPPQVHHSTVQGALDAKEKLRVLWALPRRPTEVPQNASGSWNELWGSMMV